MADHELEVQKLAGPPLPELKSPERKGLKLEDYLGEAGLDDFLAQREENGASNDDRG